VFRSTKGRDLFAVDLLVTAFHRGTTVKYLLIAAWGVVGAILGVPSLQTVYGHTFQVVYSLIVAAVALVSAFAAAYFPKHARLELFSASVLIALMLAYPACLAWMIFHHSSLTLAAPGVMSLTLLVIPAVRVAFVYRWLVDASRKLTGEQ